MSAFIVSEETINVLVNAIAQLESENERPSIATLKTAGDALVVENHNSVNYRYSEHVKPAPYRFTQIPNKLALGAVAKAIECYEYQSCEHDGWLHSPAFELCAHLKSAILRSLPGYEEAAWH